MYLFLKNDIDLRFQIPIFKRNNNVIKPYTTPIGSSITVNGFNSSLLV
jgi:hypothetical protein